MTMDKKNGESNGAVPQQSDVVPEAPELPETQKLFVLDEVLTNEVGQFGMFQLVNLLLLAIPNIMVGFMTDFIFVAAHIPHRCMVPECGENSKDMPFHQDWLSAAIPDASSCERFAPFGGNGTLDQCPAYLFDQGSRIACDGFVYERDNSIVYDFDMGCQEWQRALSGTMSSVGTLLVGPITGFISDRFGRRVALIFNCVGLGIGGLLKAFSVNYAMYLSMQILQAVIGGGTFSAAYILATELVGPKYRVLTGVTCSAMFATGQVIVGAVAWAIQPWRHLILVLYMPCFLIIVYYWIVSESVRWLISKRKFEEAIKILKKIARVNNRVISEKSLQSLMNPPPTPEADNEGQNVIATIWKSPVLRRRVCTTPIWWISTTFVYYGLSINSVSLSDSVYLNFILTSAIEIPGFYTGVLLLDWIGRRMVLSGGYFLSAACCIAFILIPTDLAVLRLIVYLLGKFGISLVMTSLYLYTSELYPTRYRHSLLAFSYMIGRIGSIVAPLTPALMQYWTGAPSVMFAGMALLAGVLVLTQPETLGTRMPDTLAEAEALGNRNVPITTQL